MPANSSNLRRVFPKERLFLRAVSDGLPRLASINTTTNKSQRASRADVQVHPRRGERRDLPAPQVCASQPGLQPFLSKRFLMRSPHAQPQQTTTPADRAAVLLCCTARPLHPTVLRRVRDAAPAVGVGNTGHLHLLPVQRAPPRPGRAPELCPQPQHGLVDA